MSKKGMSRPERTHIKPHNEQAEVPEIQGKAKHKKAKARPIIAGTTGPKMKVYHVKLHEDKTSANSGYDTDLAVDNLENDLPEADKRRI